MYARWRPRTVFVSVFEHSLVTRIESSLVSRGLVSRRQSRVSEPSEALLTITKQPEPQPVLRSQDQVRTRDGTLISRGDFVELKDGDFLKVTSVSQHTMGSVYHVDTIQGLRLRKTKKTLGFSRKGSNDLYLNLYMNVSNGKSIVTVSDVLRRRNMILSNSPSHEMKLSPAEASCTPNGHEVFHCDWIRVYHIKGAYFKSKKRGEKGHNPNELFSFSGTHIERFTNLRFRPNMDILDIGRDITGSPGPGNWQIESKLERLYDKHTDQTLREDMSLNSALGALSIDSNKSLQQPPRTSTKYVCSSKDDLDTPYTFGDLCCGCGGASRGAVMAGLRVKWGLDLDPAACDTWRLNFPEADSLEMDACDIHRISDKLVGVDILHISNPCQYFSKAHTMVGKNDEANVRAAMIIGDWLDKAEPRIVTLENVDGLLTRKKGTGSGPPVSECFDKIQQQFETRGYAFSCQVVNITEYGLPQNRERLIIIAARKGTNLPPMPDPTHAEDPEESGLLPYVTVKEALNNVPKWPDHKEPLILPKPHIRNKGDWLAPTIMDNTAIRHFSGKRNLSLEEYARLQGFPDEHRFGRGIKRQIGNAQPPSFGKVLYTSIRRHLQEQARHNI